MSPRVYTTRELNAVLRKQLVLNKPIKIGGVRGHSAICVGIDVPVKITVEGEAGDFFAALNDGGQIRLVGSAGKYLGSTMLSGSIVVDGSVDEGVGVCMRGGELVVRGNAGPMAGANMYGGVLVVDGDVGPMAGWRMQGGRVIVTGDAAQKAGEGMLGGVVYVAGDVESVGAGAELTEATNREKREIGEVLERYGIKAKLALFEKIVPVKTGVSLGVVVEEGVSDMGEEVVEINLGEERESDGGVGGKRAEKNTRRKVELEEGPGGVEVSLE